MVLWSRSSSWCWTLLPQNRLAPADIGIPPSSVNHQSMCDLRFRHIPCTAKAPALMVIKDSCTTEEQFERERGRTEKENLTQSSSYTPSLSLSPLAPQNPFMHMNYLCGGERCSRCPEFGYRISKSSFHLYRVIAVSEELCHQQMLW